MNLSVEIPSQQDNQSSTGTTTTAPEVGFPWSEGTDYMCLFGMIVASLGFVFNFFCYITTHHMPQTNSAHLMRLVLFLYFRSCFDVNFGRIRASLTRNDHDFWLVLGVFPSLRKGDSIPTFR